MEDRHIFMAVAVVSLVNGMFSPAVVYVYGLHPFWVPEFFPRSVPMILFLSQTITAFGTLLISGIPAALFERAVGSRHSTPASLYVWLVSAVLLTLPALSVLLTIA